MNSTEQAKGIRGKPDDSHARAAYETAATAMKAKLEELGVEPDAIETNLKELAAKCGYDYPSVAVEIYQPWGGSRSFAELDNYLRTQELTGKFDMLNWQLQGLMDNVLRDSSLDFRAKADAIAELADEFASRAGDIPQDVDAMIQSGQADLDKAKVPSRASRVLSFFKSKAAPAQAEGVHESSFRAVKEGDTWRWFAVYSNVAFDRTGERFPEAAHKDYVAWVDQTGRYPELWDWHTPVGIAVYGGKDSRRGMGKADFVHYDDGLAIAAGYFYPEFEDVATKLSQEKDVGVSHGYEYQPWALDKKTGEYAHYFTFEISPLPREKAANAITLFLPDLGAKEEIMNIPAAKRAQLVSHHGEEKVKAMEAALSTASGALKDSGLSFKDLDDALTDTPAVVADAGNVPPAPQPAAGAPAPNAATAAEAPVEDQVKAFNDFLTRSISEAVATATAPILDKVKEIEGVLNNNAPRGMPDPSRSPSADPANILNGNTAAVQQAKSGDKDAQKIDGVPDHLQYYFNNGVAALVGTPATPVS